MATKRASPNSGLQRQKRAITQKRGQGVGADYQPFIQVRRFDLSSFGRSHIWRDPLHPDQEHHLLSDLERFVLLQALASGAFVRTQYPLCVTGIEKEFSCHANEAGTQGIADNLKIRHPAHSKLEKRTMTTDFLLRFPSGRYVAIYVKYKKEMLSLTPRQLELLKIEKEYWRRRKVRFIKVSDEDVKINQVIRWLDWVQAFRVNDASAEDLSVYSTPNEFVEHLLTTDARLPMRVRLASTGIPFSAAVTIVKYCLWTGLLKIDYAKVPLPDLSVPWVLASASSRTVPSLVVVPVLRNELRRGK